jgi:cytochrome c peroxidase
MKGAFKTPTLRDIALTAPYMRNGVYRTLEEVVDHYDRGGDVKDNLSPKMKPLGLSAQEKADPVAFMKSLTGRPVEVAIARLPQ